MNGICFVQNVSRALPYKIKIVIGEQMDIGASFSIVYTRYTTRVVLITAPHNLYIASRTMTLIE